MKLKWALVELKKNGGQPLHLSGALDLSTELKKRYPEMIAISPVQVDGYLFLEHDYQVLVSLELNYQLTLPSSRSLKPVDLDMTVPMTEIYLAPVAPKTEMEKDQLVFRLEYDWIDLKEPIIEAILTAMPLKVLTPEEESGQSEMPSGDGWSVLSEEEAQNQSLDTESDDAVQKNSPFSVLKEYFDTEEDE